VTANQSPSARTTNVLVIGTDGYVGRHVVDAARADGHRVVGAVRRPGSTVDTAVISHAAAFDDLIFGTAFDQIVCLPQLTNNSIDWIIDRIDGPRWIVFSSAQLAATVAAPGTAAAVARENLAVSRGAVVLRPTMIFGHGGDQNISRLARIIAKTKIPVMIGGGGYLVQPVHVDDLLGLVSLHRGSDVEPGVYAAGGAEAIPARELLIMITELLGVRVPPVNIGHRALRLASKIAPLAGLRPDQILRLTEDKTIDISLTKHTFDWEPMALAHRVEQAVGEAVSSSGSDQPMAQVS